MFKLFQRAIHSKIWEGRHTVSNFILLGAVLVLCASIAITLKFEFALQLWAESKFTENVYFGSLVGALMLFYLGAILCLTAGLIALFGNFENSDIIFQLIALIGAGMVNLGFLLILNEDYFFSRSAKPSISGTVLYVQRSLFLWDWLALIGSLIVYVGVVISIRRNIEIAKAI